MQRIYCKELNEECYEEELSNGLIVQIIPKHDTKKKYVIWGTRYGSMDNEFIVPTTGEQVSVPDGVAHFLEHKMFEQRTGRNALDTLMGLGAEANAYTTIDHTAYLFECTNNFEEIFDEFMDYVQNPYYTDENVQKEMGIIGQEIAMGDDEPGSKIYFNTMRCLYQKSALRIDIAGTQESISHITKETLYNCYNTFYHPSNMVLTICGDFEPEGILKEIEKRLIPKEKQADIKRIYPEEPEEINQKFIEEEMEVSLPVFMFGIKCKPTISVKQYLSVQIILNMLLNDSSNLYQKLYEEGLLLEQPGLEYEMGKDFGHIIIVSQSKDPKVVFNNIMLEMKNFKDCFDDENFARTKKRIYGEYAGMFNSVSEIARFFMQEKLKGMNAFDFPKELVNIDKDDIFRTFDEIFSEDKAVCSIINPITKN